MKVLRNVRMHSKYHNLVLVEQFLLVASNPGLQGGLAFGGEGYGKDLNSLSFIFCILTPGGCYCSMCCYPNSAQNFNDLNLVFDLILL